MWLWAAFPSCALRQRRQARHFFRVPPDEPELDANGVAAEAFGQVTMPSTNHIAVVGSREYPNPKLVREFVSRLPAGTVVVSGGADGVDGWAEVAAKECGLETLVFVPDWKRLGGRAGPIRNEQIVIHAGRIVAFWDGSSRGTLNTLVAARDAAVPVDVFGPDGEVVQPYVALRSAVETGVFDAWIKGRQRAGKHVRQRNLHNMSVGQAWLNHQASHLVQEAGLGKWMVTAADSGSRQEREVCEEPFPSHEAAAGSMFRAFLESHVPVLPRNS